MITVNWWAIAGAGALDAAMCALIGWLWGRRHPDPRQLDREYDEGFDDGMAEPRTGQFDFPGPAPTTVPAVQNRAGEPRPAFDPYACPSCGSTACAGCRDWREQTMTELDERHLDAEAAAEYLPGPADRSYSPKAPGLAMRGAGELHHQPGRIRLVDMGDTGDTAMLDRDWFDRREFLKSLRYPAGHPLEEFGGFDLTDTGHVVAVA